MVKAGEPLYGSKTRVFTQAQMERRKRWAHYRAVGADGFFTALGNGAAWVTVLALSYRAWHPLLLEVLHHIRWVP